MNNLTLNDILVLKEIVNSPTRGLHMEQEMELQRFLKENNISEESLRDNKKRSQFSEKGLFPQDK